MVAVRVLCVGSLPGCSARGPKPSPYHGNRKVAAVGQIAGLRGHQRRPYFRHLSRKARLSVSEQRDRQASFDASTANDQRFETITSAAAADIEKGSLLHDSGMTWW